MGRPSVYSHSIAREICDGLAASKSLRACCEPEGMPSEATVRGWVLSDEHGFAAQYARARAIQAMAYADDLVEISDTEPDPQRARVRIDARKWIACKLLPKVYGDKVEVAVKSSSVAEMSEAEILARLATFKAGGQA